MSTNTYVPVRRARDSIRTRPCFHLWNAFRQRHHVVAEVGYQHAEYLKNIFEQRRVRYAEFAVYAFIPATLLEWSVTDRDELAAAVDWARDEHARLSAEDLALYNNAAIR